MRGEAYERMIALVTLAEQRLAKNRKPAFVSAKLPARPARVADVAPIVRGACSLPDGKTDGAWKRFVLDFRGNDAVMNFVNGAEVARYGQAGVVTPDHNIRIKNRPLVVAAPEDGDLAGFRNSVRGAVAAYGERYQDYFARNNARVGGIKTMLDPMPRVVLVPGVGLFGLGRSKKDAQHRRRSRRGRDCHHHRCRGGRPLRAAAGGRSVRCRILVARAGEARQRQGAAAGGAGRRHHRRRRRDRICDRQGIRGGRRRSGAARCRRGRRAGESQGDRRRGAWAFDATSPTPHRCGTPSRAVASAFGGVDIAVSNAGAAWQGRIGEVDEAVLRQSFELNFYGHQRVAQAAVKIMRAQGTGGCLLFNVSKQAVNPGPDFGPYGLPKAATLFLVRQYALDYGSEGIRANAVNADRIRSGLLTEEMIASRSKVRGVSEQDYMRGNLLGREVAAEDVAQAFLAQALALKTTADVTTVDGGNIAAALR